MMMMHHALDEIVQRNKRSEPERYTIKSSLVDTIMSLQFTPKNLKKKKKLMYTREHWTFIFFKQDKGWKEARPRGDKERCVQKGNKGIKIMYK